MAMKIVDEDSGKKFYPSMLLGNMLETSVIQTVSRPCNQYREDCLYDMEASAFYQIAVRFSSSELIQCIKVVSDNQDSSIENIHSKLVNQWLSDKMTDIGLVVESLLKLQESIAPIELDEYQEIIKKWHFTVSGQIKLKALLRRWKILSADARLNITEENFSHGKELLKQLETEVDRLEINL